MPFIHPCAAEAARAMAPAAVSSGERSRCDHLHGRAETWSAVVFAGRQIDRDCCNPVAFTLNARTVDWGRASLRAAHEMLAPGVDPHVRRPGKQAIEHASWNEDAVEQLQQDPPDGACCSPRPAWRR